MPKKEDIPPTTEDKIYETRKSLPLYKKIQYFVQANRGWVVKIVGLLVVATLVLWVFLMQDEFIKLKVRLPEVKPSAVANNHFVNNAGPVKNEIDFKDTNLWKEILEKYSSGQYTNIEGRLPYYRPGTIIDVIGGDSYQIKVRVFDNSNLNLLINENTELYIPKDYVSNGIEKGSFFNQKISNNLIPQFLKTDANIFVELNSPDEFAGDDVKLAKSILFVDRIAK